MTGLPVYVFKKKRTLKEKPKQRVREAAPANPEEEMGLINGVKPASIYEWRTAKALWKLGHTFEYQYPIGGGRTRGGQVLDFLVDTKPLMTPVYVNGSYWHTGRKGDDDLLKIMMVTQVFNGMVNEPVILWDYELMSTNDAYRVCRQRIGL